jgi:hypothetical protein
MLLISGQVTGIISAAALSFMVHEPRGIMEVLRPMSLVCKWNMYLITTKSVKFV